MDIFLDLDGPILDNRQKYAALYRDLLNGTDARLLDRQDYWELKRRKVPETEILVRSAVPRRFHHAYVQERLQRIEDFSCLCEDRVWPGVIDWLRQTAARHPLYLVTMRKRSRTLRRQLEHFDVARYFTAILSEDRNDGTAGVKQRLIRSIRPSGGRGLMIGDTAVDIRSGRACGLATVALTCGIRTSELLQRELPDFIYDRLTDVQPDHLPSLVGSR